MASDVGKTATNAIVLIVLAMVLVLIIVAGIVAVSIATSSATVPATSYSHLTNPADTCTPFQSEAWEVAGVGSDPFNYGFGSVSLVIGEYSSDFTGLTSVSISFSMCGYKNDSIADPNLINIGIFNQADGSLRQTIGTVAFDSIPTCHLNQDGSGGNCSLQHPSLITVTGRYTMQDAHSPGGTDFIGISFPVHSAVGHDVFVFCSNACSATVVPHGGICDIFASSVVKSCHAGASNTDNPGVALAGTLLFVTTGVDSSIIGIPLILIAAMGIIALIVFILAMKQEIPS